MNGKLSLFADVDSCVPQGTALDSLLFMLHINDLPSVVNSKVLIYREIKTIINQSDLQKESNSLQAWHLIEVCNSTPKR